MVTHDTASTINASGEQRQERLRQERTTFDQHKAHENRWFMLRLVMGYAAALLLLLIFGICVYIFLNHPVFPPAIVTSAGGAFFVDVVGLVVAVWKIVFNPGFMTRLAPVTQSAPVSTLPKTEADENAEEKAELEKITVFSATYGKGANTIDVTERLRAVIRAAATGHVSLIVNNDMFGPDPLKGEVKELKVVYSYAGETYTKTVQERAEFSLPRQPIAQHTPQVVSLRAWNRCYVFTEGGVEQEARRVLANEEKLDPSDMLSLIREGDLVAFRTNSGFYLCAEAGGGHEVLANRRESGPWEKFWMIDMRNGKVAFRTSQGFYLCARDDSQYTLAADRNEIGEKEQFKLAIEKGS